MRRQSPAYYSPPRRGYGGRGRSPPGRKYGGGRTESGQSLLVRNIPLNCRSEDLRIPFERFGRVRDVYMPKDYYSGEPRGFAFVEFVDPYDAAEAQYHMNHQRFGGREITVVVAAETRKRPEDMRHRARLGEPSRYDGRRSSAYGRSRSRTRSRSRSPYYRPTSRTRQTSRSYSPAPKRHGDYSVPPRRHSDRARSPRDYPEGRDGHSDRARSPRDYPEGRGGHSDHARSPSNHPEGHDEDYNRRSESPGYSGANKNRTDNGHVEKDFNDDDRRRSDSRSPRRPSVSPSGSRSRSSDLSPERSR